MLLALHILSTAQAGLLPDRVDDPSRWPLDGGWHTSPASWEGGSRVALITEASAGAFQARGLARDGAVGPWVDVEVTFSEGEHAVRIAELGQAWDGAELRVRGSTHLARWTQLEPQYPDAGWIARSTPPTPRPPLDANLAAIGVVSREQWGARATTCTSREDDWYRMAIHHTAGGTTYGGTVEGQVRFLQSYAQDSGTYCDVPYQFLVGVDGSLYEGRSLTWTSGATGGGNNDGNIAVSFMGCFHPNSCPGGGAGDAVTQAMMDGGNRLVRTLASLHGVPTNTSSIRGHRDWPGNQTACPGDWLHARLPELWENPDVWAGELVGASFDDTVEIEVGETVTLTVDVRNTGNTTWTPGATNLATLPRDAAWPLADATWVSSGRPATIDASTAPGEVGQFSFTITGTEPAEAELRLAMVQEWVTWFADDGGPVDGFASARVVVVDPPEDTAPVDDTDDGSVGGHSPRPDGLPPGEAVLLSELGCAAAPSRSGLAALLLALAALGRRRR